jgi:FkbM family methyltransferase
VPDSRSQPTSDNAPSQSNLAQSDWVHKTANQALVRSYLAVFKALDTVAATWTSRRPPRELKARSGAKGPRASGGPKATTADVRACYRLLLGRPPDAGGLAHYRERMSKDRVTVNQLVSEFLGSVEFAHAHEQPRSEVIAREIVGTAEGFRIHVDPTDYAVGHTVARTGEYEPDVSATVRGILTRGATLVDIGANIGWFSLLGASVVGPSGRVLAIEPNPRNATLLRESAKDNGFDNIDVLAVALAERAGAAALETDGSNGRVIPIDGPPSETVEASFVVATYPLDALLEQIGTRRVDVIKIDVEGAEPLVLRGATRTIAKWRPWLISEFYPLALESSPWGDARGYLGMLRDFGYRLSVIGHNGVQDDEEILDLANQLERGHVDLLARPD